MSEKATFLVKVNCTMDKDGDSDSDNFKLSTIKDIKIEGMALADQAINDALKDKIKAIDDIIDDGDIRSGMNLTFGGGKKTAKRRRRRKRGKKSRQRRK